MTEVTRTPLGSAGAAAVLRAFGVRRAVVMSSPSLANTPILADAFTGLAEAQIEAVGGPSGPDLRDAEGIVSIGGGRTIRAAREFAGRAGARHVAIPTTTSCVEQFDAPSAPRPDAVIFDVRGIRAVPRALRAAHALNAMTYAVEAMCDGVLPATAEPRAIAAIEALRRGVSPANVLDDLDDAAALELLAWAADAGRAAAAGAVADGPHVGLARATGEALSARCAVPYATCVALMLPFALAYCRRDRASWIARIAPSFGVSPSAGDIDAADAVVAAVRALAQAAGLPSNFRKAGVSRAAMEGAARAVPASLAAPRFGRPVASAEQMMNEVFRFAW